METSSGYRRPYARPTRFDCPKTSRLQQSTAMSFASVASSMAFNKLLKVKIKLYNWFKILAISWFHRDKWRAIMKSFWKAAHLFVNRKIHSPIAVPLENIIAALKTNSIADGFRNFKEWFFLKNNSRHFHQQCIIRHCERASRKRLDNIFELPSV
jgi:hypothetical protein